MEKITFVVAAALLFTATSAFAQSRQVKGSEFVTIMKGNTLSATSNAGVEYKAYFIGGGIATYEDENGKRDHGKWRINSNDEVCVTWNTIAEGQERCARVYENGNELVWKGEHISGEGKLLGTVN